MLRAIANLSRNTTFFSRSFVTVSRCIESISKNKTISLSLPDFGHNAVCFSNEKCDDSLLQQVELSKDLIQEHAARRVDLFFYLLVAVYKEQFNLIKENTVKQHGQGSIKKGTHACHSSLFPNTNLSPLFFKTHFYESLNSTVELPKIVNDFDGCIEGKRMPSPWIIECQSILNAVSRADIDPRHGMTRFFKVMDNFFRHYYQHKKNISLFKMKIYECEKKGTFLAAHPDMTLREDYLYLMLRLNQSEIDLVNKDPDVLSEYYFRIQQEIFNNETPSLQRKLTS